MRHSNNKVMKENHMKTIKQRIIGTTVSIAIAMAALLPLSVNAADTMKEMKGGEHMMMLNVIKTESEAKDLKVGDSMAMVCSKCKSVTVQRVTVEKGHLKTVTPGEKHLCPGCGSIITVVGVGKGAKDEVKHVCGKCGSGSAFCCATKPGSGMTDGMEKSKEPK
jgi:hypothetical protein